ncbi:hypothetical protein AX14_001315 [Amanita brunnescens Koide BX004]|nr:hypothetical protein AX14_001315 [Amanita brunnescens Koide BX004]
MELTRISQPVWYPDGSKARPSNDGTDPRFSTRIFFNGQNGLPMHQMLGTQQGLNDAGDAIQLMPTKTRITLLVSWKEYRQQPCRADVQIGADYITRGELAHHAAELFRKTYEELRDEHGAKAPHLEEDPQLERPLSFERLVLMSLDRISPEDDPQTQWWQVAFALKAD